MASFRCYDNSDVIATLIMTNFHLFLTQLWWQFFQMFVYGDIVYAQTWQVLTLKNCIEAHMCQYGLCCCIVWPSFLFDCFVKIWATCKNSLGKWFAATTPPYPPWPKIARTPMPVHDLVLVIPSPPLIKVASNTRPCSKPGGPTVNGRGKGG